MSKELSDLFAKMFVARRDVKAIQNSDGSWRPHTDNGKTDGNRLPWTRKDFYGHLDGSQTFGHYLLNEDDQCKLFAFDIDLIPNQLDPAKGPLYQGYWVDDEDVIHPFDARESWLIRKHPSRNWQKYQMKMLATRFAAAVTEELDIPVAAAYSGGKGVHVYGFTGLMSATDALEGAMIVLESVGGWEATRGSNFFRSTDQGARTGYPNFTIEVFPKQTSLGGKDLGNLMRLPLGVNRKNPRDPTFFIDLTSPMGQMVPRDPIEALTQNNWSLANA